MARPSTEFLFDADVLIDYCEVDSKIIRMIADNLGAAYVATDVLKEVNALSRTN